MCTCNNTRCAPATHSAATTEHCSGELRPAMASPGGVTASSEAASSRTLSRPGVTALSCPGGTVSWDTPAALVLRSAASWLAMVAGGRTCCPGVAEPLNRPGVLPGLPAAVESAAAVRRMPRAFTSCVAAASEAAPQTSREMKTCQAQFEDRGSGYINKEDGDLPTCRPFVKQD